MKADWWNKKKRKRSRMEINVNEGGGYCPTEDKNGFHGKKCKRNGLYFLLNCLYWKRIKTCEAGRLRIRKSVTDAEDSKPDAEFTSSSNRSRQSNKKVSGDTCGMILDDHNTLLLTDYSGHSNEDLFDRSKDKIQFEECKIKDEDKITEISADFCLNSDTCVIMHSTCTGNSEAYIRKSSDCGAANCHNVDSLVVLASEILCTEIVPEIAEFVRIEQSTPKDINDYHKSGTNITDCYDAPSVNVGQFLKCPDHEISNLPLFDTHGCVDRNCQPVCNRLEDMHCIADSIGKKNKNFEESKKEQSDGRMASDCDPLYDICCSFPIRIADSMTVTKVFMLRSVQVPGTLVHEPMKSEWNRLATFVLCDPPDSVFVTSLAHAGFFLPADSSDGASNGIKVTCAFCSVVLDIAKFKKRNVMDVHRKASPRCRFVLGEATGNVSVADFASTTGEQFLSKYSGSLRNIEPATVLSCSTQHAAGENQRPEVGRGHTDDIATDAEQQAVTRPSSSLINFQDLATKLGASALSNSSLVLPPPLSKQLTASGQQPSIAARLAGETVADARPAQNITVTCAPLPTSGSVPFQTATLDTPTPTRDAATGVSTNRQSRDGCAGADTSSNTAAAGGDGGQDGETAGTAGRSGNAQERQTVTYEDLGIISQKPKRPDMAVTQTRINTFTGWIHEQTHPKEEMAEAGFYYTGHEDLVRCFHCKGGLKTWESSDTPWVEHARWFPRCPFIKLCKGQRFIDAVQKLNDPKTRPTISQEAVVREMKRIEEEERQNLSPDVVLFNNLPTRPLLSNDVPEIAALRIDAKVTEASMNELAEQLEEENEEIRSSTMCKMCQTNEVNVLFLPCGHLVACSQCAPALTTCAMCRQPVKGSVRVHLDDNKLDSEQEMGSTHPDPNSQSAA